MRPVDPDPPRPAIPAPGGVRGTTATPEQLGHTPVSDQEDRPGRRKHRPAKPAATDTVTLDSNTPAAPKSEPGPKDSRTSNRQEHVDLRG